MREVQVRVRGVFVVLAIASLSSGCGLLEIDPITGPTDHSERSTPSDRVFPISPYFITLEFGADLGFAFHLGDDILADPGDPVFAVADGVVIKTLVDDIAVEELRWGALVVIQHTLADGEFSSLYGHLSSSRGLLVEPGQVVAKGDIIGFVADGEENGVPGSAHLHFGVRMGDGTTDTTCGVSLWLGATTSCEGITHEQYRRLWADPVDFLRGR